MRNRPIGILDSGIGGLTVLKEIAKELPQESLIYIGDSLNTPYGNRSSVEIYNLSKKLVNFLLQKKVKLIVVACNTITVNSINALRADFPDIPFVGTVPVVKTAAAVTKNKKIGILSTTQTATSEYQKKLIKTFTNGHKVINLGTDKLVPLIEQGELTGKNIEVELLKILSIFKQEDIDTIALGCTHFAFLRTRIKRILGPKVQILDSGPAIARQVRRILQNNEALSATKSPVHSFYITSNPESAQKTAARFFENKFPGKLKKIKLS